MGRNLRKNRSEAYQPLLLEISCANETLTEYSDGQGLTGKINLDDNSEELFELKEKLRLAYWRIINTQLTERQREVLRLTADGYTQCEIAKVLMVNQSSITKALNGNVDYKDKKNKRIYGGAKKKLRKLASEDLEIIELLRKISELQD